MFDQVFAPISLEELNAKAEMLTRLDNKYAVSTETLSDLATEFAQEFDILEIGGQRSFRYRTCYFDDCDLTSFHQHRQGRRNRAKVRVRRYLDADLCFLEVKLKTVRKVTVKKRLAYEPQDFRRLTEDAIAFVEACHQTQYGRPVWGKLSPVLEMEYERLTLVAKKGGERVTIDRALSFEQSDKTTRIANDMVIVETKSRFGRGIGDRILRRIGEHPVGSCSKYCVGLAAVGAVQTFNKFLPAYRKLMPGTGTDAPFAGQGEVWTPPRVVANRTDGAPFRLAG